MKDEKKKKGTILCHRSLRRENVNAVYDPEFSFCHKGHYWDI